MKTKHTPGPWKYSTSPQPNGCPIVGNDRGLMVCMLAHSINHSNQKEEALSNAALIAASPELLAALSSFLDVFEEEIGDLTCTAGIERASKKAREAITKAITP